MAYAPQPSFDDVAWYGLAYLRVYEMDKTATDFFRVAKDIYHWIWVQGWDDSGKHKYDHLSLFMIFYWFMKRLFSKLPQTNPLTL